MVGFIDPVAYLDGADQEIAGDHKGEVALYRRLEGSANDGGVVDTGDRGADVQFRVGIVEELDGDSRKRSGSCILEDLEERVVECDLSFAKHPRLSWHRWLASGGRSQDGVPQAFWCRWLISPRKLANNDPHDCGEENIPESVNHRIIISG
jgi:hypothetical protein